MSKQRIHLKILVSACRVAVVAISFGLANVALANQDSTESMVSFGDNPANDPDIVAITGEVKCTSARHDCVIDDGVQDDEGNIDIEQRQLNNGDPAACNSSEENWVSVGSGPPGNGDGTFVVNFETIGLGPSTIGFRVNYIGSGPPHGTQNSDSDCLDLTILEPVVAGVSKSFVSGPTDVEGAAIDLQTLLALTSAPVPDPTGPDDGIIGVALVDGGSVAVQQFFKFNIEITALPDGAVVTDTVPGEFDLAGDAEDYAANGVVDSDCTNTDDTCDGFTSDDPACVVETSRAPGASEGNLPKLEPEFLTITVDGLGSNTCTVMVWVKADGNPGHLETDGGDPTDDDTNVWTLYEPTGCRLVGATPTDPALPMVDTVMLNDGLIVFEPVTGDRVSGPEGALHLTPIGCDSDDDGFVDEEDGFPLDPDFQ